MNGDFVEILKIVGGVASSIVTIVTLLTITIKPLRERLFARSKEKEGMKCLLRNSIIRTYYAYQDEKQIPEYEFRNIVLMYDSYVSLGGNSFIKKIYEEMCTWTIVELKRNNGD